MTKKQKKALWRIIAAAVLLFAAVVADKLIPSAAPWVLLLIYAPGYLVAGADVLKKCAVNIVHGALFDEAFLMTVATLGAVGLSLFDPAENEFAEAVFVMVFYQTGELFQSIAVGKSRKSIAALTDIAPDTACMLRDGQETTVFPEEIEKGDILIVRPGDRIAADGVITEGSTSLDLSALTGESVPVEVSAGDSVLSGGINLGAVIRVRAENVYAESTVAKILDLIENSSLNKAKTELTLTKFARVYTPAVVFLAVALAVIGGLASGNYAVWLSRALIFLVVSCPCAIVISVPMAYFGGIGGASAKGILVKGSDCLEALGRAKTFIFDKTGTLTRGVFAVTGVYPENGISKDELLSLAACAEYYSVHPVGIGIKNAVKNPVPPESFENAAGRGVRARINGGDVLAGSASFMEENGIAVQKNNAEGLCVYVASDGSLLGSITADDTVRDGSAAALGGLKKLGVRRTVMLTGDRPERASSVAERLGIDEYYASLLPTDKVEKTRTLCRESEGGAVFVGDGINDAPALALADCSVSLGGIGSDAAVEAADIVIMNDDVEKLPAAVKIAKKTEKIVWQNIVFALGVKLAVLLFASFGIAGMWAGSLADVGVAVLCILNSMRTLKGE